MTGSLTLPAIAFLAAVSGIPGLSSVPMPASKEFNRAKAAAVAADTLPIPWKPAWRLALDRDLLRPGIAPLGPPQGPIRLNPGFDPRQLQVSVDPVTGTYRSVVGVKEVPLALGFRRPLHQFTVEQSARSFQEKWAENARRNINSLGQATPVQRSGLSLPIPVKLPQRLASILGPGGPALNVSGSESIRLSGTSNWTNAQIGVIGQKQSLFPSLDLQQDLDIRLEGQLSDRIKVNLLQNSANQVPLANRIAINYRGDEDDFMQALDLGNTSLTLPGTQYVSYSGKNEGLFGVKMATRIGALDFTALASKQEGRSERAVYSGGGSRTTFKFSDLDWVKGQYFLLYDPSYAQVFDVDEGSIRLYLDDGVASNDLGETKKGLAYVDPDDAMGLPLPLVSDTAVVGGTFKILNKGPDLDFEVLNDLYAFNDTLFKVIRLRQPIPVQSNMTLAVTYRATPIIGPGHQLGTPIEVGGRIVTTPGADSGAIVMKLLRVPRGSQTPTSDGINFDSTAAYAPVRELELKNLYYLGGFGLDPKSFKLSVQAGQDEPPITDLAGIPFIESVGLDNWNEQTLQAVPGEDGVVDNIGFNSQTRGWVDYTNGTLFLPDPRPFAPRLAGASARPFDQFVDARLRRRNRMDAEGALNAPNPKAYDLYNPRTNDAQWYFQADFAAARTGGSDITLGRGNILDNSEAVIVNGERWVRDRDYSVDYDLGRITLKRQLGPADQLSIDYSYAPLFAQASKTLIGSAFRLEGRDRSLGGAFLYESKGAQDLRPRLGEEPSRTWITDLNGEWRMKPYFLTRLVDNLPGVRTTMPSELNVQAEVGMSFPNPNTRNEVYVDDMEGVRDAVSLSLTPDRWRWTSVPRRALSVVNGNAMTTQSFLTLPKQWNAEVHWFVPVNSQGNPSDEELVRERDLRPKLSDAQGGQNVRNVLAISVPKKPNPDLTTGFVDGDTMWVGLTYNLDNVGIDLSRSQFIELWVNDWNDHHDPAFRAPRVRGDGTPGSSVKMHIEIGKVSEDQMRAPNRPPNRRIDTEDQVPRDNQLTVVGETNEDTGIDGVFDNSERDAFNGGSLDLADLITASTSDPEGDNWATINESFTSVMDPRRYVATNGTEASKDAFPIPDTEDMNLNEVRDTTESYFQYTIDLGAQNSPYLQTDVLRDFPGEPEADSTRNGWRRYRIPLNDSLRVRFGFPDLTIAQHVRVWFEGLRDDEQTTATAWRPMLMLGGLDIVGSRWLATDLTPRQRDTLRTVMTLNAVNSVDNAEIYVPPFDPGTTRSGSEAFTRREQSLAMEFTNLHPADTLEAYKPFSLPENYSRYGALNWFAAAHQITKVDADGQPAGPYDPATDSLFYFMRFASDDKGQSYYEIKRKVPLPVPYPNVNWEEIVPRIEDLSAVKLRPDFPQRDPILYRTTLPSGDSLILRGRPSFTRLLRISYGLVNESNVTRYKGEMWFDELRATDVAKDVGLANRLLVNGKLANLMDFNVALNSRDADFLSVGETRGSGNATSTLNISTRIEPHRFFEGTGIVLPVTFSQNTTSLKPRFTAGDDIVRSGALAEASETKSTTRVLSTSYSRIWSERTNPLLRYTLGGLTASGGRATTDSRNPTLVSNSVTTTLGVNYNVALRQLMPIPLPLTRAQLFPLPERFYWAYNTTNTQTEAFTRVFGSDSLRPSSSQNGRATFIDFGMDTRPIDMLSHHIEGRRNLALEGVRQEMIGNVNFGRLTSWRQSLASHVSLNPHPFVRPSFSWSSSYNQVNDPLSADLSARSMANGQELGVNWDFPFDRLTAASVTSSAPPRPDTGAGANVAPPKPKRPLLPWRQLLSRLGPISADGRIGRSSTYSRLTGTASPLYLLGLAENPGFDEGRVNAEPGNTSTSGVDWRTNARTTVPIAFGSSVQLRASLGERTNNLNGTKSRFRDLRFPDVEVQYGRLANLLGVTKIFDNPQFRTAYARSTSVDYQNSHVTRTGTSRSDDFRPLFSIRGRFKNGTDADLRLERRSTEREQFQLGNSKATDQTTDVNFSLTRSYSQGQKVTVLGRETTIRKNVSLSLTSVYSRQKGGVKVAGEQNLANPVDRTRLSVNTTGTYGFSTNVTGDLALGFSHFRETNGIIRRSVRVELRGQFRF
jgi:hypothetical protein